MTSVTRTVRRLTTIHKPEVNMSEVAYKRNDTVPLEATLPVDSLTDADSVTFHLKESGSSVLSGNASIIDEATGKVAYQWQSDETDRTGPYNIEWEIEWSDGGIDTYPKSGTDTIYFFDDIA